MSTSVANLYYVKPKEMSNTVYIDRRSKWGNPFRIGPNMTREQAVAAHREWLPKQPLLMAALPELKGKVLLCWCKPLPCHGDFLVELVENLEGL